MDFKFFISLNPYANSLQPDNPKLKLIKFIVKSVSFCKAPKFFPNGETFNTASLDAILSV